MAENVLEQNEKYFHTKKPSKLPHVVIHLSRLNSAWKICNNKIITISQSSGSPWKEVYVIIEWEQTQAVIGLQISKHILTTRLWEFFKSLRLLFVYVSMHLLSVRGYAYNSQGTVVLKSNLTYRYKVYVNGWWFECIFTATSCNILGERISSKQISDVSAFMVVALKITFLLLFEFSIYFGHVYTHYIWSAASRVSNPSFSQSHALLWLTLLVQFKWIYT